MTDVKRPPGTFHLLKDEVVHDTAVFPISGTVFTEPYRHFLLFLEVDSTGTDDHVLQVVVQFSHEDQAKPYDYKQGLFAALFYEDQDTASGISECFSGRCWGREISIKLVGTGVTSSLYFTVSAWLELLD